MRGRGVWTVSAAGRAIKPAALTAGATLAVLSPASTPNAQLVQRGVERLEALGYKAVVSGHALDRGPLYYAGTREERLADFHAAFADPEIDGIICTRGGWGSAELLPYLDAALIRANPKVFIGYSDHTSLHCWLQNEANLVTFYGPMVAADFARDEGVDAQELVEQLWRERELDAGRRGWSARAAAGVRRRSAARGMHLDFC